MRHIFRLLEQAIRDQRPVPWVLLENVSGADISASFAEAASDCCC